MTKAAAIYQFWTGFGLNAYEQTAVPTGDDAPELPYITYEFVSDGFGIEVALSASLWYRSTSWVEVNAKAEEIARRLGVGGVVVPCDDGLIWIKPGQPFAQNMSDPNDGMIRRKYINILVEYNTTF